MTTKNPLTEVRQHLIAALHADRVGPFLPPTEDGEEAEDAGAADPEPKRKNILPASMGLSAAASTSRRPEGCLGRWTPRRSLDAGPRPGVAGTVAAGAGIPS